LDEVGEALLRPIVVGVVDAEREVAEVRVDHTRIRNVATGWETSRLFDRERRREAVAILRGVGKDLPAAVAGIARGRSKERARGRLIEVVERLRRADREPGELNEHPVRAEVRGGALRAVVVHTDLQIATQGAVLGLLAAIEPRIGAGPQGEVLPVLPVFGADRDTGERPVRHARTVVISVFPTNISADLEADIGARDVVEAVAVKAADLHVLHRRRLDRQFGGLSATDRNQSRGRPEENAFHDLTFSALNL